MLAMVAGVVGVSIDELGALGAGRLAVVAGVVGASIGRAKVGAGRLSGSGATSNTSCKMQLPAFGVGWVHNSVCTGGAGRTSCSSLRLGTAGGTSAGPSMDNMGFANGAGGGGGFDLGGGLFVRSWMTHGGGGFVLGGFVRRSMTTRGPAGPVGGWAPHMRCSGGGAFLIKHSGGGLHCGGPCSCSFAVPSCVGSPTGGGGPQRRCVQAGSPATELGVISMMAGLGACGAWLGGVMLGVCVWGGGMVLGAGAARQLGANTSHTRDPTRRMRFTPISNNLVTC